MPIRRKQDPQTVKYTELIDQHGAALHLGYCDQQMAKMRCEGRGPDYYKIGCSVRYLRADLDRWVFEHRIVPEDAA